MHVGVWIYVIDSDSYHDRFHYCLLCTLLYLIIYYYCVYAYTRTITAIFNAKLTVQRINLF